MNDPRTVVADPSATYYGIAVGERSLVPGDGAMVGEIRLDDWLREAAAVPATGRGRVGRLADPSRPVRGATAHRQIDTKESRTMTRRLCRPDAPEDLRLEDLSTTAPDA